MMNKTDKPTPRALLQQSAEQLAQRHRRRLHEMTRQAVYGQSATVSWWSKRYWPAAIAVPALSLMAVVLVLQIERQTQPSPATLASNLDIPAWVEDTDVPVAVLQNMQFYQWLEHELDNPNHS